MPEPVEQSFSQDTEGKNKQRNGGRSASTNQRLQGRHRSMYYNILAHGHETSFDKKSKRGSSTKQGGFMNSRHKMFGSDFDSDLLNDTSKNGLTFNSVNPFFASIMQTLD